MKENAAPKRRGRPPLPDSERKGGSNITFRARAGLRERLLQEATAAGRSISEEVERRLEDSFSDKETIDNLTETLRQTSGLLNEIYQAKILADSQAIKLDEDAPAAISTLDLDTVIKRTVEHTLRSIALAHAPSSEEGREYRDAMAGVLALAAQEGMGHVPLPLPSFAEWKAERARSKAQEYYEPPDEPQDGKETKGKSRVE